jgi:hypothetical protein
MPNLNGMKFPYTPAGKQRYQQIKKQISQKVTRPAGGVKPIAIGRKPKLPAGIKAPSRRNPIHMGIKKKLR